MDLITERRDNHSSAVEKLMMMSWISAGMHGNKEGAVVADDDDDDAASVA